jgi:hypothetical protein
MDNELSNIGSSYRKSRRKPANIFPAKIIGQANATLAGEHFKAETK